MTYEIRPYHSGVAPAILALTRATLGNTGAVRKTEDFWQWKHHANPFGPSYGLYAWSEPERMAIGLRMLMRWQFQTPTGERYRAARAVDTATHPAYQRQGIFSTLTRQAITDLTEEGCHFIFNTPNAYSLPGYLKMGWQRAAEWPLFIKPLRPLRMMIRRLWPVDLLVQFETYFGPGIISWSAFIERYDPATLVNGWEKERAEVGLRTRRDMAYLQWRYGEHPHLTYGVYPLETGRGLSGFAVLRPNKRYGWQEIVLAEIFLARPDLSLGQQLLRNMIKQIQGDYLVAHFAEQTLEKKLLRKAGFIRAPGQKITFTVRPLNLAALPAGWDLSLGELEVF